MCIRDRGNDRGTQYRSAVFYTNDAQKNLANTYIQTLGNNIVTEVSALDVFYLAEAYHQNYFNNNSNQPYCQLLIAPKLDKYFDQHMKEDNNE